MDDRIQRQNSTPTNTQIKLFSFFLCNEDKIDLQASGQHVHLQLEQEVKSFSQQEIDSRTESPCPQQKGLQQGAK